MEYPKEIVINGTKYLGFVEESEDGLVLKNYMFGDAGRSFVKAYVYQMNENELRSGLTFKGQYNYSTDDLSQYLQDTYDYAQKAYDFAKIKSEYDNKRVTNVRGKLNDAYNSFF